MLLYRLAQHLIPNQARRDYKDELKVWEEQGWLYKVFFKQPSLPVPIVPMTDGNCKLLIGSKECVIKGLEFQWTVMGQAGDEVKISDGKNTYLITSLSDMMSLKINIGPGSDLLIYEQ